MYGKFHCFVEVAEYGKKHDKNFHMTKRYLITTEDGNNKLEEKNILVWAFHAFVYNPSLKKKCTRYSRVIVEL